MGSPPGVVFRRGLGLPVTKEVGVELDEDYNPTKSSRTQYGPQGGSYSEDRGPRQDSDGEGEGPRCERQRGVPGEGKSSRRFTLCFHSTCHLSLRENLVEVK